MPNRIDGQLAPFPQPNVDTDVIMPKRFLKTITRQGLADGAFADLRFDDDGKPLADFVLNRPAYRDASILVAGGNFGCGSSREHAVWGLMQLGIKAIIGTDFGGIFYDNARKNGLALPIVEEATRDRLLDLSANAAIDARIDIEALQIVVADTCFPFQMGAATQQALIEGQDETLDSLAYADQIRAFEKCRFEELQVKVIR